MKILIKELSEILDDKLSLVERGVLITLLLLKDKDSKLTLAKFKAKVKMNQVREELVHLHNLSLIKWSGYKATKKALEEKQIQPEVKEVVDYMNGLWESNFKLTSKSTTTNLIQRLKENSIEDLKLVIANRYVAWKDDSVMRPHLNPTTVFRPSKFDKYLEEATRTKTGEGLLNATKTGLKEGDEINFDLCQNLSQDDFYKIRIFNVSETGQNMGSGRIETKKGSDLIRVLKILKRAEETGSVKTRVYYEGR